MKSAPRGPSSATPTSSFPTGVTYASASGPQCTSTMSLQGAIAKCRRCPNRRGCVRPDEGEAVDSSPTSRRTGECSPSHARSHRALTPALRLTVGGEAGGDWIRSSNLGDRSFGRGSGFAEAQWHPAASVTVVPSVRFDHYTRFGSATSPALSAGWWATPRVKIRGAAGRAYT